MTDRRSPSPAKPLATAHVLLHPAAAPLPRTAILAMGVAAALLLFAVADLRMPMRMPMELRRLGDGTALRSGSTARSTHHAGCGGMLGAHSTASGGSGGGGSSGAAVAPAHDSCKAAPDVAVPSPFARSCTLLRDACVDQERVVVYGRQNSTQPWQLAPNREHAKFLFELADPLVSTAQHSAAQHSMAQHAPCDALLPLSAAALSAAPTCGRCFPWLPIPLKPCLTLPSNHVASCRASSTTATRCRRCTYGPQA